MDKIKETNSDDCYYEKDYLKIRFNSNDGLPLNKPLKFHLMTIPIRYVFEEEVKFSPQVFLDDTLYELIGYERIDIGRTNKSKECLLCHYWNFLDKNFSYGPYLCDECYNIMHKSIKFKNIAIINVKKSICRIYFLSMSKRKAKKLMNNSNLIDKKGVFIIFFRYI